LSGSTVIVSPPGASARFRPEKYYRPTSVKEAVGLLDEWRGEAAVIAGGTDLLVKLPPGVRVLVDVGDLGLGHLVSEGEVRLGAGLTLTQIERSAALLPPSFRILSAAAGRMGTPAVRNRATIGGNVCNASPAADLAVVLLALGAVVCIAGLRGRRELPLGEFFLGPGQNALSSGELVVEFRLPSLPPDARTAFERLGRQQSAVDLATVNVATVIQVDAGRVTAATIALGAVAETPLCAVEAAGLLAGRPPDEEAIEKAAEAAMAEIRPIDDVRASASYRRRMVGVLVRRALRAAFEGGAT
jgi:CO/xanthine dehydrogenase FAD-binding subunit